MNNKYILPAMLFAMVSFTACKGNNEQKDPSKTDVVVTPTEPANMQEMSERKMEESDALIKSYVAEHKLDTNMTPDGLVYQITKSNPKGKAIHFNDKVKVKYRGTLLDGTEFDAGVFEFVAGAGSVIRGWDEGIELMREGEKMTLIIPFWQGYGDQGSGPIPPYATLVFDMEAVQVTPGAN